MSDFWVAIVGAAATISVGSAFVSGATKTLTRDDADRMMLELAASDITRANKESRVAEFQKAMSRKALMVSVLVSITWGITGVVLIEGLDQVKNGGGGWMPPWMAEALLGLAVAILASLSSFSSGAEVVILGRTKSGELTREVTERLDAADAAFLREMREWERQHPRRRKTLLPRTVDEETARPANESAAHAGEAEQPSKDGD